jgi:hypothetical protein
MRVLLIGWDTASHRFARSSQASVRPQGAISFDHNFITRTIGLQRFSFWSHFCERVRTRGNAALFYHYSVNGSIARRNVGQQTGFAEHHRRRHERRRLCLGQTHAGRLHRASVLKDPAQAAGAINHFLGGQLDSVQMAAEVRPSLNRQRPSPA